MTAVTQGPFGWPVWTAWLVLAGVILLIELAHPRWILIWFALGAAVSAAVATFLPSAVTLQILVFLVVSIGLMATARPITYHLLFKRRPHFATNAAAIIGREEICTSDIDNLRGRGAIRVYGSVWHAVSSRDDVKIKAGQRVRVVEIRDLDLVVEPVVSTVRAEAAAGASDRMG